jgi:hypothetical protein
MDPRIADFIAKNQGKYTREAIRQQLIDAGHEPAAIDATWAALYSPDPDETSVAGEGFWPRFFLFLIGLNVAVFLFVALSTGMLENLGGGGGALAGVFAVALGIGALIAWGIVAAVGPARLGRTTAMVIGGVIPIIFALLVGGSCYALASAIGPPPLPSVAGEMELEIVAPFTHQATATATCNPSRNDTGFSVYGESVGQIEGDPVFVAVDSYDMEPGNRITTITISVAGNEANARDWSTTSETRIGADAAADGSSGTVTFEGLGPGNLDPALGLEPISGTIRWSCG